MKENKNNTPFKAEDVNWEELAAIGILKDELEMAGELDTPPQRRENERDSPQPGIARCGCRYGRHPSAGAEERHPVTGNQRYQTHRTIVFNLPFP